MPSQRIPDNLRRELDSMRLKAPQGIPKADGNLRRATEVEVPQLPFTGRKGTAEQKTTNQNFPFHAIFPVFNLDMAFSTACRTDHPRPIFRSPHQMRKSEWRDVESWI
jgi:hypothetical protein